MSCPQTVAVVRSKDYGCLRPDFQQWVITTSLLLAALIGCRPCGERKKIELVSICFGRLWSSVMALALHCVRSFLAATKYACVAVRFVTLCCVAEIFMQCLINYVRACVMLHCVTYCWKSGITLPPHRAWKPACLLAMRIIHKASILVIRCLLVYCLITNTTDISVAFFRNSMFILAPKSGGLRSGDWFTVLTYLLQ